MLHVEAWILLIVAYAGTLLAYFWPPAFRSQSPTYVAVAWTAFMFRTFLFYMGLGIAMVITVAALARWRRWALAGLPLAAFAIVPELGQYLPKSQPVLADPTVRVMTMNLLAINTNTAAIANEITLANPDILLLQEYTPEWHASLQHAIRAEYPHISFETRDDSFGAAVYSKLPFIGQVDLDLPVHSSGEPQIRAVIEVSGRQVAVYNIHLLPPMGLDYTMETRAQFADLCEILEAERLPLILAGDFNFTPNSFQAATLRKSGLQDAHHLAGTGRGTTWPNSAFACWIPPVRLDQVYLSSQLGCTRCTVGIGEGSDHRPVVTDVGFVPGSSK